MVAKNIQNPGFMCSQQKVTNVTVFIYRTQELVPCTQMLPIYKMALVTIAKITHLEYLLYESCWAGYFMYIHYLTLWDGRYCYPHLRHEIMKAQRGEGTHPGLHSQKRWSCYLNSISSTPVPLHSRTTHHWQKMSCQRSGSVSETWVRILALALISNLALNQLFNFHEP